MKMLRRLGGEVFGDTDPAAMLHSGHAQRMERDGTDYVLCLDLPFTSKEDIELVQKDSELYVKVGPYKREISLPRVLARRHNRGARMEGAR